MSDIANAILDAAERRIREAGYSGFSFREIAADVGVKSSSVHYHFPTKERLAAAVARRYTDRFAEAVSEAGKAGLAPAESWHRVFRKALVEDGRMCLCGALAAAAKDLPEEVRIEAQRFFQRGVETLVNAGLSQREAMKLLANLEGAMLVANALGDTAIFDEVAG
ncbi:TetR/AcrR family transcriptional regulator [Neorhizobium sp. P12A]|uniref:TetR/AcrR family transcriptional regulator n=1 Tax=Neorhizobium sp. P12A TaxID=2268027 RepID=UPI0011F04189|nr:TetR/AcrR family transcriptional regulator [Neorhizobium sp. P12A]KAA0701074.1 TetR/AcrR family transcriptional regulator [Neorhizobium sp. P12A]